jgi:hypothetical protein
LREIPTRRKLIYAAMVVAAMLLVLETVVRVRAWVRYGGAVASLRDPMIHHDPAIDLFVPTPGYELQGGRINIKINSLGFRGDEFAREKPPGTVRIAVLGASTTFNSEVSSNHATWPHRLQERLRAAHPDIDIEVINASLGGYVAADNLKNLRHRVLPLDPDLVIYYEANNEIVRDTGALAVQQGLADTAGRSRVVSTLSNFSLLFDLAYKNLAIVARSQSSSSSRIDRIPRDLPARFVGVLDEMRTELDRRQIPFMLSTFVVKYRPDQDRATQIANADVSFYYMPWMSIDGMLDAMEVYNGAILDYAAKEGLAVVDDRHAIPPDAEHFTDCMHLADKGAEAMADRFFRYMRTNGTMERLVARSAKLPGTLRDHRVSP